MHSSSAHLGRPPVTPQATSSRSTELNLDVLHAVLPQFKIILDWSKKLADSRRAEVQRYLDSKKAFLEAIKKQCQDYYAFGIEVFYPLLSLHSPDMGDERIWNLIMASEGFYEGVMRKILWNTTTNEIPRYSETISKLWYNAITDQSTKKVSKDTYAPHFFKEFVWQITYHLVDGHLIPLLHKGLTEKQEECARLFHKAGELGKTIAETKAKVNQMELSARLAELKEKQDSEQIERLTQEMEQKLVEVCNLQSELERVKQAENVARKALGIFKEATDLLAKRTRELSNEPSAAQPLLAAASEIFDITDPMAPIEVASERLIEGVNRCVDLILEAGKKTASQESAASVSVAEARSFNDELQKVKNALQEAETEKTALRMQLEKQGKPQESFSNAATSAFDVSALQGQLAMLQKRLEESEEEKKQAQNKLGEEEAKNKALDTQWNAAHQVSASYVQKLAKAADLEYDLKEQLRVKQEEIDALKENFANLKASKQQSSGSSAATSSSVLHPATESREKNNNKGNQVAASQSQPSKKKR